jgi:hypothetical protein
MSESDEDEFVAFLRSMPETSILPGSSSSPGFVPVDPLPEPSQDESTRKFWLHNRIDNLPLVTEFDEEKGLYFINGFQSPVIQFLRSYTISKIMLPGRLEADMAYFDDDRGDLVSKPLEFRYWFESIEKWIRTNFKHLTLLTYLGPGAEKFRSEGGLIH